MASALAKPALDVKVPTKLELAKEEFFNQPDGFPFEKFRIEDVTLPPDEERAATQVDDEEEVAQDVAASQETGFGSSISAPPPERASPCAPARLVSDSRRRAAAVDGLPEAPEDKLAKLEAVVKRRFEVHGEIKSGALLRPLSTPAYDGACGCADGVSKRVPVAALATGVHCVQAASGCRWTRRTRRRRATPSSSTPSLRRAPAAHALYSHTCTAAVHAPSAGVSCARAGMCDT